MKINNGVTILTGSFLVTNSLNKDISSKKRLCSTVDLFSVVRVVLMNTYKICKRFYIFQRDFKVLKLQYFKLLCVLSLSEDLIKLLRWRFLLKAVNSFHKKVHLRYLDFE